MPKKRFDPAINWEELQREWRARVVAEYHSASFTAELLHLLIQIGAPYDLVYTAHRIVKDELVHAERSFVMLRAVGGEDSMVSLHEETLVLPAYAQTPLEQVICVDMHTFCLGETFAVPLFREMARRTKHPKATSVLKRILRDESVHREFGWALLDHLLERDDAKVKEVASAKLGGFLREFQFGYGTIREGKERVTSKEEPFGLMPRARYVKVFEETLQQVIFPRFQKRGIEAKSLLERATQDTTKEASALL